MPPLLVAVAMLLPVCDAPAGLIFLDISTDIDGHDLGVQADGTIIVGGIHNDTGRLAYIAPDLSSYTVADIQTIAGTTSGVQKVSDNGEWFVSSNEGAVAGRGMVDVPGSVQNLGFLGPSPETLADAVNNAGTAFVATNGQVVPAKVPVGEPLEFISSSVAGLPTGVSVFGPEIVAGGAAVPMALDQLHAVLWNQGSAFLPRDPGDTETKVTDVAPDATLLATNVQIVTFNPITFEFDLSVPTGYYRDIDGVVAASQSATDYVRVLLTNPDDTLFQGTTSAVTNLVDGWIGGSTVDEQAWLMNVHTMDHPVLAKDYFLSEFGFALPSDPTNVEDLLVTPDNQLLTLFDGSTFLTSSPAMDEVVPEPSSLLLLATGGVGLLVYRRRRRKLEG